MHLSSLSVASVKGQRRAPMGRGISVSLAAAVIPRELGITGSKQIQTEPRRRTDGCCVILHDWFQKQPRMTTVCDLMHVNTMLTPLTRGAVGYVVEGSEQRM